MRAGRFHGGRFSCAGESGDMTQYQQAVAGVITPQMRRVAERERVEPEIIRREVAAGRLVIPANRLHLAGAGGTRLDPCGIGRAVSIKINANLGTSPLGSCREQELVKLRSAVRYGADTVMDLSTGSEQDATREFLIAGATVPVGTVPIYSMIARKPVEDLACEEMLEVIARQARQGVDFFTIHAGLRRRHLPLTSRRKMGIVSRGGSLLASGCCTQVGRNPCTRCSTRSAPSCATTT